MNLPFRSLSTTLLVPFVLLITAVVGVISYLSYSAGVRGAETVSRSLLEDVATRIAQTTSQYLASSSVVLNVVAPDGIESATETLDFTALSPLLVTEIEKRLWVASGLFPAQNSYVYYASESGRFVGVERKAAGGPEVRLLTQASLPRRVYRASSPEKRGELLREENFNPHERPWYRLAIESGNSVWTPPYKNFSSGELTITLAKPVFRPDGTIRGVAATDLSLAQLTKFVRDLQVSDNGVAFVVEPGGRIIAASTDDAQTVSAPNAAEPGAARNAAPLVRDAYAALVANSPFVAAASNENKMPTTGATHAEMRAAVRLIQFESELGEALLSMIRYRDAAGLDWQLVVALPRTDYMAPVYKTMAQNLGVSALALLIAIALGSWFLQRVASDVSSVSRAAEKMISGRGPITRIPNRDDEIGVLASSMAAIQDQLWFDKLTGALNRAAFSRQFTFAVDAIAPDEKLAVIYIDLDRFKRVNDRYGHAVGDAVLAKSAERIRRRLREKDLFARYGGDEFVIMVRGNAAVDAIDALVDRLRERLSAGMTVGELNVSVGASIGVATYPGDGVTLDELVVTADRRMYEAKRKAAESRGDKRAGSFMSAP